ncbi:hypothetical protein ACA910_013551 [Epithemia clementina (nom. ined.)]
MSASNHSSITGVSLYIDEAGQQDDDEAENNNTNYDRDNSSSKIVEEEVEDDDDDHGAYDPPGDVAGGEEEDEELEDSQPELQQHQLQEEEQIPESPMSPHPHQEEEIDAHDYVSEQEDAAGATYAKPLDVVLEDAATINTPEQTTPHTVVGRGEEEFPSPPLSPAPSATASTNSAERKASKSPKKSKSSKKHHKSEKSNSHRNRTAAVAAPYNSSSKDKESSGSKDKESRRDKESSKTKDKESTREKDRESSKAKDKESSKSNKVADTHDDSTVNTNTVQNNTISSNMNSVVPKSDDSTSSNYDGFEDGDQDLLVVEPDSNSSTSNAQNNNSSNNIPRVSTSSRRSRQLPTTLEAQPPVGGDKTVVDWITPGVGYNPQAHNHKNSNGGEYNDDDTIATNEQQQHHSSTRPTSKEALYALHLAAAAAQQFEKYFGPIKNSQLENMTPLYHSDEVLAGKEPLRFTGYFTEYSLTAIRIVAENNKNGASSLEEQQQQKIRRRFMERSIDGYYSVKYVQAGLIEATDHGGTAAADMIYETRILMNLRPQHPNVTPIYGVNCGGIDSFLETASAESPKAGFFFITDRIVSTLPERIDQWRKKKEKEGSGLASRQARRTRLEERMSIAFDIASALVFLHNRNIVYHIRPDKIGFDAKQGIVKLCNFSQARYDGMRDHQSQAITRSDDITTLAYTSPEALCKAPCTTACDVYSFGIMLWELMSLRVPFEGYDRARHFHQVVQQHKRPPLNKKWSKEIRDLLPGCWDPHLRSSMKTVNETLEKILMLLNDEQNQINLQKSHKRSKSKTPVGDRSSAAVAAASSVSRRDSEVGGDVKHRMSRRNSTGAAEEIKLAQAKAEQEQQQALQEPDSPSKKKGGGTRKKIRRQNSADGIAKLKDHFKAAKRAAADEEVEAEAATYAPKSSSRGKSASRSVFGGKVDNSDARSVSSSASALLRSYKSPRRSTLSHVPAGVRRQPLFRRKQDDPTAEPSIGDGGADKDTDQQTAGAATAQSTNLQTSSLASNNNLGVHSNPLQLNVDQQQRVSPRSDSGGGANQRSASPSNPRGSASPIRTIRKKLSTMRSVFSGQNRGAAAPLIDNDENENSDIETTHQPVQPLAPPSPPEESAVDGHGRSKSRRASFAF